MVDRIAPSVGAGERARANAQSGVEDETPVIGESFTQWVMEDEFIAGRPAFDQVGVQYAMTSKNSRPSRVACSTRRT